MNAILTPQYTIQQAKRYAAAGDVEAAEHCYRAILEQEPFQVEALYRLALLLRPDGARADEVLGLLRQASNAQTANPLLHMTLASVLSEQNQPLEALESMAEAASLQVGNLDALYNLGLLCAELCCPAQAEVYARYLLRERPDWPAAHYLLVRALTGQSVNSWELEAEYDFVVKSDPLNPSLRFARGLHQLRRGNYAAGWEAQEWRWEIEPVKSARIESPQPRWAGGPLAGRRLLVLGEQGFGDVLQFCRYLPLLIEKGAHVILRLDANRAALARLLRRIDGLEVVVEPPQLPEHDLYCPLASLPYACATTTEAIPPAAYLDLHPADVDAWRARLASLPRPWIGVCWGGSGEHDHDIRRSLPLCESSRYYLERLQREQRIIAVAKRVARAWGIEGLLPAAERDAVPSRLSLQPLLEDREGSFVSLQVGPHAAALDELPAQLRARFIAPLDATHDFYDTACLVRALDEVITVDTSVAHVTGSVGQRGMVITPAAPEWRWLERVGHALWYPSLRPVEQGSLGSLCREFAAAA
jgi:tetratricopeptide (TPR) repeat protein